jgi:hypothetical protein
MPTRSELIAKAASLPKGDTERRELLASLSKKGKVELFMRRPGAISVNVRVAIRSALVGNVIDDARKVLDSIEQAFTQAKKTLEADGAWVDSISMPHLHQFGLNTGRGGVSTDHFWYFKYESPETGDEADAKYGSTVIKVLEKALKANGIRV